MTQARRSDNYDERITHDWTNESSLFFGGTMNKEWPLKEGMIVAIEETLEGQPDSGVFQVNPKTRKLREPRKLQAFEVGKPTDGAISLEPSEKEPELYLKMNGGWRLR